MQEGDWIYTLDEELHERLRNDILGVMSHTDICRTLVALSLSRIALTLEQAVNADGSLDVFINNIVKVDADP